MALTIAEDECISCGDCEPVCPTQSIKSGILVFTINRYTCTECAGEFDAPECVRVCPVDNCILPLEVTQ